MVTIDDYFRAYDSEGGDWRKRYPLDLTPRLEANAERTVSLINQLLTEMDGMNSKKTVFIIGATNR